jgi:hypothetical protein
VRNIKMAFSCKNCAANFNEKKKQEEEEKGMKLLFME